MIKRYFLAELATYYRSYCYRYMAEAEYNDDDVNECVNILADPGFDDEKTDLVRIPLFEFYEGQPDEFFTEEYASEHMDDMVRIACRDYKRYVLKEDI